MVTIDCISDLHGHYPELEGGDLLIVAGDLTSRHTLYEYMQFIEWIRVQEYKKKIVIAGNHDTFLIPFEVKEIGLILDGKSPYYDYLCDSGTEFEGLKIWGSPWTKTFPGMNPRCKAFTLDTDEELSSKFFLIPDNIDILITHCAPYGFFDQVWRETKWGNGKEHTGSKSLRNHVMGRIKPDLHIFGHIHEWGGKIVDTCLSKFVNASHVNEFYQPVNKPVRVIL